MKRLLSRHAAVALLVLLTSTLGGLSLAVVAFGQSGGDPDATVPAGDFTGTTPTPPATAPLSGYTTTTTSTTPTVNTTATTPPGTTDTNETEATSTNGAPSRSHGTTVPNGHGELPSRATGSAPTKMAFTGGEPILIGGFGAALMLTGVALHERRRRRAAGEL
jgi:hypothetical protein